jgi:hypothetical protein
LQFGQAMRHARTAEAVIVVIAHFAARPAVRAHAKSMLDVFTNRRKHIFGRSSVRNVS